MTDEAGKGLEHPEEGSLCIFPQRGLYFRKVCYGCSGTPTRGQRLLRRSQLLCVEGDDAEYVYPIVDGYLKETCLLSDGRVQGIRLAVPGDVVGIEALIRDRYQSTAEALTAVKVCAISVATMKETLLEKPEQGLAISSLLAEQVLELRRSILHLGSMSATERTTAVLRQITAATPRGEWMRLPLSRQELAELLGLSLSTVSRIIQQLAREKMLDVRGRMVRFLVADPMPPRRVDVQSSSA